jgi:hypothetical protein
VTKRYVLLVADEELTESEVKDLAALLEGRHGKVKVIALEGDRRGVVVKTTNELAPYLRDSDPPLTLHGKRLKSVLTSGSIGKLKRRRSGSGMTGIGEVHE